MTIENIFNFTCWNKQYLIVAERLRDNNLIHIQNIIPKSLILEAQWTLKELIKLIYNDDLESINSIPIEKTLYNLAMQNRQKISYIYDAFKDSVIFSKICLCENLQLVAQYLLKHEVLSSPSNHWVFRVDLPEEQRYIFKWHYDLPYNMLGRRGLTFWIPLTNISLDMGPVVYSKLQEKELLPIELEQKNEKYSNAFIKNEYYDSLEYHAATSDIMEGDCFLFNAITPHRSGINRSHTARLSVQVRFSVFNEPDYLSNNWVHRRPTDGNFDKFLSFYQPF